MSISNSCKVLHSSPSPFLFAAGEKVPDWNSCCICFLQPPLLAPCLQPVMETSPTSTCNKMKWRPLCPFFKIHYRPLVSSLWWWNPLFPPRRFPWTICSVSVINIVFRYTLYTQLLPPTISHRKNPILLAADPAMSPGPTLPASRVSNLSCELDFWPTIPPLPLISKLQYWINQPSQNKYVLRFQNICQLQTSPLKAFDQHLPDPNLEKEDIFGITYCAIQ